jgi:ATP-dependent protease ClpP protease subunit
MFDQPRNVDELRAAWRAVNDDRSRPADGGFRIDNAATPKVYVFGVIGGWRMPADQFVKAVHAIQAPAIDVHINSQGGFVWDAVAMYEALRSHPATVNGYVDGLAASAASFVLQAADNRIMATGSRAMIHDAQVVGYGSPAEVRAAADLGDAVSNDIASIYADRAGGSVASWRAAMSATTWYSAAQTVDAGLADQVSSRTTGPDNGPGKASTAGPDNRTRIIQARVRALTTPGG